MLCKVSAFHVYTHEDSSSDDIENCLQCDLAIENQVAELSVPLMLSFEKPLVAYDNRQVIQPYLNTVTLSPLRFQQFGRPPPFLG